MMLYEVDGTFAMLFITFRFKFSQTNYKNWFNKRQLSAFNLDNLIVV